MKNGYVFGLLHLLFMIISIIIMLLGLPLTTGKYALLVLFVISLNLIRLMDVRIYKGAK